MSPSGILRSHAGLWSHAGMRSYARVWSHDARAGIHASSASAGLWNATDAPCTPRSLRQAPFAEDGSVQQETRQETCQDDGRFNEGLLRHLLVSRTVRAGFARNKGNAMTAFPFSVSFPFSYAKDPILCKIDNLHPFLVPIF